MTLSPLRQFVIAAVLWLPACFFLWAIFASPVVWPIAHLADLAFEWVAPEVIAGVEQNIARLEAETRLTTSGEGGRVGIIVLESNPLIYAWSLPLFAGLVMATPLPARRRLLQLAIGLPVLWLVATWGAVFDILKLTMFDAGPLGQGAMTRAGWSADAVGLGYQFGYLILPAVVPVVLWIAQNRRFLESLVGWVSPADEEPAPGHDGRSDANSEGPP